MTSRQRKHRGLLNSESRPKLGARRGLMQMRGIPVRRGRLICVSLVLSGQPPSESGHATEWTSRDVNP